MAGADISADYIRSFLASNGVVHGLKEDVLEELEMSPRYGRPIVVAEGTRGARWGERAGRVQFQAGAGRGHAA